MSDDETMGNPRHNSTSDGKDWYPSISQLLATDSNGFKRLTGKLTKDWILCFLRDSLVHLKQAKLTFDHFSQLENKLDNLITNAETVTEAPTSCGKSTMTDIVKASLDERDYDKQDKKTIIVSYNVKEKKMMLNLLSEKYLRKLSKILTRFEVLTGLAEKAKRPDVLVQLMFNYLRNLTRERLCQMHDCWRVLNFLFNPNYFGKIASFRKQCLVYDMNWLITVSKSIYFAFMNSNFTMLILSIPRRRFKKS